LAAEPGKPLSEADQRVRDFREIPDTVVVIGAAVYHFVKIA
jgi:hypothetical protein